MNKTPMHSWHMEKGALMCPFAGWSMPIHYGSQIKEHQVVRKDVGMFDVSHMCVSDCRGKDAVQAMRYLLANDVSRLKETGQAMYSVMLNEHGFIIDDLIVYYISDTHYRLVTNAGTWDKDWAWMQAQTGAFDVQWSCMAERALIAIQGPNAREKTATILPETLREKALSLKPFSFLWAGEYFIARTGYTGEDGFEIILPPALGSEFFAALGEQGVQAIGLAARDTLRLEAGLNLYGQDMDESTHPYESNIGWTVSLHDPNRQFIGKDELIKFQSKPAQKLIGLILKDKAMLRSHQKVLLENGEMGCITSGSYSPTLGCPIAFARIPNTTTTEVAVEIRGKAFKAQCVPLPFWRKGRVIVSI